LASRSNQPIAARSKAPTAVIWGAGQLLVGGETRQHRDGFVACVEHDDVGGRGGPFDKLPAHDDLS